MNPRRALLALGCAVVVAAVVLCLTPVTVQPSSLLPGPLRDALPTAFKAAETSCGSVARPHEPSGFSGVLSSIATLLKTECTKSVRDRMWAAVWVALVGLALILIAVLALPRRSPRKRREPAPLPPPEPMQSARSPRRLGIAAFALVMFAGCGGDGLPRSTAAFCTTLKSEQARILAQFHSTADAGAASGDGFAAALAGLGASLQALGELRTYFHKLAAVAPAEVQTEAQLVADSYDDQVQSAKDAISHPLEGLATSILGGVMISGQLNTLNQFALRECGQSI